MNLYKTLKIATVSLGVFYLGLLAAQATTPECAECAVCEKPSNVWYKVSTFEPEDGNIVKLDMTRGKSFTDHEFIYIVVKDLDNGELVYIVFPNGGEWVADTPKDEFLDAMEEEFKNLEDYLRSKESQEIKKKQ